MEFRLEDSILSSSLSSILDCSSRNVKVLSVGAGPHIEEGRPVVAMDLSIFWKDALKLWDIAQEGKLFSQLHSIIKKLTPEVVRDYEHVACAMVHIGIVDTLGRHVSWEDIIIKFAKKAAKRKRCWRKLRSQLSSLVAVEKLRQELEEKRRQEAIRAAEKEKEIRASSLALLRGEIHPTQSSVIKVHESKQQTLSNITKIAKRKARDGNASLQEKRLGEVAGVYGSIAAPKGFGEKAVHEKDNSRAKDAKETTTHADGQISDNKAHDSAGEEDTYDEKVAAEEERLKTTVKLIDTVEESKGGGGTNDSDDEDVEAKQSEEAMLAFEMAARKAQLKAMKKIAKKRAKAEAQQRAMEEEARLEKNRKEEAEAEESRKKAAAEAEALEAQRIAQEQAERKEKMRQEAMSGVSEEMAKSDTAESALPAVRRKDKVVVKKRALMKVKGAAKLIGSLKRSAHERHANRQPKAAAGKESDNRRDIKEDDATGRNGESLDVEINRQIPKNTRKTGEGHADRTAKSAAIFLASPAGKKNRKR